MLTRRAVPQKYLIVGPAAIACGLFAAFILAPFQERGQVTPLSAHEVTQSPASAHPLILQEGDGEHRVGRPPFTKLQFTIKVDEQNGNARDFFVGTTIMPPGDVIPFHMHHNAEELVILEEGGATVTVGDKRAVAGPHSIVLFHERLGSQSATRANSPSTFTGSSRARASRPMRVPSACWKGSLRRLSTPPMKSA